MPLAATEVAAIFGNVSNMIDLGWKAKCVLNPLYSDILIQEIWDCPLYNLKGHMNTSPNYDAILSLNVVVFLADSADPDEMQHNAAFHLGIHFLRTFPFRGDKNGHYLTRLNIVL